MWNIWKGRWSQVLGGMTQSTTETLATIWNELIHTLMSQWDSSIGSQENNPVSLIGTISACSLISLLVTLNWQYTPTQWFPGNDMARHSVLRCILSRGICNFFHYSVLVSSLRTSLTRWKFLGGGLFFCVCKLIQSPVLVVLRKKERMMERREGKEKKYLVQEGRPNRHSQKLRHH